MTFADKPTLIGSKVRLRPIVASDAASIWRALDDPEATRLTGTHATFTIEQIERWAATRAEQDDRLDLAVVDVITGDWAGEVVINNWDVENRSCSFRISLDAGFRNRGFGTEATRLIVDYVFTSLPIHRFALEVFAFNPRAIATYEKVGFSREGVMRDALRWDGAFHDTIMMSVLRPEWSSNR